MILTDFAHKSNHVLRYLVWNWPKPEPFTKSFPPGRFNYSPNLPEGAQALFIRVHCFGLVSDKPQPPSRASRRGVASHNRRLRRALEIFTYDIRIGWRVEGRGGTYPKSRQKYRPSHLQWHPWDKGKVSLYPTVSVSRGSSLLNQSFGTWEKCHSDQLSL